ncbi:AraC family transcriptional regulator [uncultured Ruminococcus sp.]|uniref:AraC family transcriptional regulator n=1 Tax=uncultured Ruminococcus sp. TaxID=165186 RepID=UPI002609C3B9|nr:AraC family transcriptional regulator [uncultured Ruminococcus sp.]
MRMVEIGYNHRHGRNFCIDRPNGTESWLMLIVKTPAHFRINGKDIRTSSHSFIIFRADTPQYYYPASNEYFDDWMHFFPDEHEQQMMAELNIPLDRPVDITDITEMSEMIRSMCFEHYSSNSFKEKSIDLYFRLLMYKTSEKLKKKETISDRPEGIYSEKLLWIRQSIYRWPGRDYSIDDMAKELSLSRSRFQHLYTETFGVSVNKDVINSRLNKAAELLRTTDLSVKEVGVNVGYSNTSYFVKLFGSSYGLTPLQFRQSEDTKR